MSLLDLIPAPFRMWAAIAAAAAAVAILSYAVGQYNDWIREPLETRLEAVNDKLTAQKRQAADRYAALEKERDEAAENWRKYVAGREDDFDAKMRAAGNLHGNSGVRYTDPAGRGCSGGSAKAEAKGSAVVPEKPATGSELSAEATKFLQDEALRADQAAIYAQAARDVALECLAK